MVEQFFCLLRLPLVHLLQPHATLAYFLVCQIWQTFGRLPNTSCADVLKYRNWLLLVSFRVDLRDVCRRMTKKHLCGFQTKLFPDLSAAAVP